ncbi:hypothetical protein RUM44_013458 [Polyplax serrata]|uniref:Uncharacterized protein n=1 Tax=Polyplax serrata TaxID=468196 RepID=A0ABR1BE79_POLSC
MKRRDLRNCWLPQWINDGSRNCLYEITRQSQISAHLNEQDTHPCSIYLPIALGRILNNNKKTSKHSFILESYVIIAVVVDVVQVIVNNPKKLVYRPPTLEEKRPTQATQTTQAAFRRHGFLHGYPTRWKLTCL